MQAAHLRRPDQALVLRLNAHLSINNLCAAEIPVLAAAGKASR
jgi:hypothetical protein